MWNGIFEICSDRTSSVGTNILKEDIYLSVFHGKENRAKNEEINISSKNIFLSTRCSVDNLRVGN